MIKKIVGAVMMICVMFFVACTSKTEYTYAIPKNAAMVIGLDLDEIARKAGLDGEAGKVVTAKLKNLLKDGLQGESARLVERVVEHPAESGISFEDKVYFFATPHAEALAVLARVVDEGKVAAMFEMLKQESIAVSLRNENECQWTQVGNALCAFNDGTFLLLQPSKGDALSMKGTLLSLMRQKEGEGYSSLHDFEKVRAKGSEISAVVNLSVMPYEWTAPLRMGLSAALRLEDIKYFLTADFDQGRAVVNAESLIQNSKIQVFFDAMDRITLPIKGKYLEYFQGNTMLWVGGNIQGKELYHMLSQHPTIKQLLDNPILPVDIESIFSSIEGDFAMGYGNSTSIDCLLYADVTNRDFLNTFEELRPLLALTGGQISLENIGSDAYLMRTSYGNFWFGVKNNRLYVTTDRTWAEEIGRTYGASLERKSWSDEVKENRIFFSVNLSELRRFHTHMPSNSSMDNVLELIQSQGDYLNVSMADWRHGKMELILKDKGKNLLQLLMGMLNQI